MKHAPLSLWLVLTVICSTASAASGSKPIEEATISPSPFCRLGFTNSPSISARKLDDKRLEVSWRVGKRLARIEVRTACTTEPMDRTLNEAGFSRTGRKRELVAGSGTAEAEQVHTPSWEGFAATFFQGNACRAVAGRSLASDYRFTLDFCISESEYRKSSKQFDVIERHINVSKRIQ